MTESKYTLDTESHAELVGLITDSVQYFCDENMISGELAWLVCETLATTKLEQLKGNIK